MFRVFFVFCSVRIHGMDFRQAGTSVPATRRLSPLIPLRNLLGLRHSTDNAAGVTVTLL